MGLFSLIGKIKIEGAEAARVALNGVKETLVDTKDTLIKLAGTAPAVSVSIAAMSAVVAAESIKMGAALVRTSFDAAASYDSLVRGLATVATSSTDLQQQLGRLQEIAKLPGIGFEEALQGSLQLQAVGIFAKLAERSLVALSNAVARGGGSKADFSESIRQLTQMASAGKLAGEDLKVIAQRVPGFSQVIKKAFGTMDAEEINKLGLSAVQLVEKITGALETLPKATGGIRTAMDNLADVLNQKLYVPIGRISAAFAGAFGPSLEKLLNATAPGFERMANAAEKLSQTSLAKFFNNTIGNLENLNRVVSITAGLLVAMAGPRVALTVISGVGAMVKAFQELAAAIRLVGLTEVIMEAIATKGASLVATAAAISAGIGVAIGLNNQLNKMFASTDAERKALPSIPSDVKPMGISAVQSVAETAIQAAAAAKDEQTKLMNKWLLMIEKNTAKSADALSLRKQSLGGSELGKMGVTAAELRGGSTGLYSPPETFSRPAASELNRIVDKMVRQRMTRQGITGSVRNA